MGLDFSEMLYVLIALSLLAIVVGINQLIEGKKEGDKAKKQKGLVILLFGLAPLVYVYLPLYFICSRHG